MHQWVFKSFHPSVPQGSPMSQTWYLQASQQNCNTRTRMSNVPQKPVVDQEEIHISEHLSWGSLCLHKLHREAEQHCYREDPGTPPPSGSLSSRIIAQNKAKSHRLHLPQLPPPPTVRFNIILYETLEQGECESLRAKPTLHPIMYHFTAISLCFIFSNDAFSYSK